MQPENKNQKISRMAARTVVKIFIIFLVMGLLPFLTGQPWEERLQQAHFVIPNKWTLAFPGILFFGFIALLVVCMRQRYRQPDYNWLLVLNGVMLLIYLAMLYSRIYGVLLG